MATSEAIVESLRAERIDIVPDIADSAFMDALDLFPAARIWFLPVRHEQTAGHMADAIARVVTGAPAFCTAQNGPGITNMVTSVHAAYLAYSPVVIMTPAANSSAALGGLQDVDVDIVEPERYRASARRPGGEQALEAAASLLAQAEFPVILVEAGVVEAGAGEEVRQRSERLGVAVAAG